MSDERFQVVQDPRVQTEYFIYDNEDKISENITDYPFDDQDVCSRIVMLLNEQQAIIQRFEEYVFSDERILCYNCLFCQEKDIYEVKCEIKGSVDVHGICQYYEKKR